LCVRHLQGCAAFQKVKQLDSKNNNQQQKETTNQKLEQEASLDEEIVQI
jgi:hypothetical protein